MGTNRRIRLYRTGHVAVDGRLLNAVTREGSIFPVLTGGESAFIGYVDDIEAEEDGWVTGVIHTDWPVRGMSAEASMDQVSVVRMGDDMLGIDGRLRGIWLGYTPCWEGMVIT